MSPVRAVGVALLAAGAVLWLAGAHNVVPILLMIVGLVLCLARVEPPARY